MGKISNFLANKLLDHVFNGAAYTPPSTVYLALSTADPTDSGAGMAEPIGNGYQRQAITFGAAASRRVTQADPVTFPQATGAWGTVSHMAIFDAVSGGNMLAHGAFETAKSIVANNTPSVSAGDVWIEFTAGDISTTLAHSLLNHVFRNVTYSPPSTYVGVATATLSDATTGSTVTEPVGGAYARIAVNANGGASPTWSAAAGRAITNLAAVTLAAATGAWGTVVASFIASAISGGDILFYDNDMVAQAVASGDTVQFGAGAIDVVVD